VPYPPHRSGLAFVHVGFPVVGPGERTSVRVQVKNLGVQAARNVTVALADPAEWGTQGIVMQHLGDLTPGSEAEAELALEYSISDVLRLGSLTVAVFPRDQAINCDEGELPGDPVPPISGRWTVAVHPSRTTLRPYQE
jgi:hypothetical protein